MQGSTGERGHPAPVLALAIVAVSAAGVLVRLAPDVSPVAAAFWRTGLVGLLLAPSLLVQAPLLRLSRRDGALILVAGGLLALHFWAWFASLHHTTVMRSTVLVCLSPIWTGLLESAVLRTPPAPRFWPGMAIALAGVVLMGMDPSTTSSSAAEAAAVAMPLTLWGDGLAVLGGMLSAAYLIVGRAVRPRISIGPYGALVCLGCAAWLLPLAALSGSPLRGFSGDSWLALLALALGPQLLGHIGLNYAVRYVAAATVAALLLLEPVGATLLSAALLQEYPSIPEIIGGAVLLLGVAVVTLPTGGYGRISSGETSA